MTKTRLLVVTRNFPPLTGGMERLMHHVVDGLAASCDITVIGPAGCGRYCPEGVKAYECPANAPGFLVVATLKGLYVSLRHRYSLVVGGSGLVAPVTKFLASLRHSRSAVFVHGLDLVVQNRAYQAFFVPFIRWHKLVIANSENTRRLAISKGCDADAVCVLHPGTEFPSDGSIAGTPVDALGLGDSKVCLFVGRMIKRKGLAEFLQHGWPDVRERVDDAVLVVVGDSPENALVRDRTGAEGIVKAVGSCPPDSVKFLGAVDNETLWRCYALADALVFPLIEVAGDVEGFGMVAIEAAAFGTPTIAFGVGGVVDAVADGKSGRLVEPGNYESYVNALVETLQTGSPSAEECRHHAEKFSWENHRAALTALIQERGQ